MDRTASANCVFCTRQDQPAPLRETETLYVMPDKFPLVPGHTLLISQTHLRCHAEGPPSHLAELDRLTATIRAFLEDSYQRPVLMGEVGVQGQTVFHAHLHVIPLPPDGLPDAVVGHPELRPIDGWTDVQRYFSQHGRYYYLAWGDARYLLPSAESPVVAQVREIVSAATGVARRDGEYQKITTPEDVADLARRWVAWTDRARPG